MDFIEGDKVFVEFPMNRRERRKALKESLWHVPSLDQLEVISIDPTARPCECEFCKQQESNMQVAVNTQDDSARDHLLSRLQKTYWSLDTKLEDKFHLRPKKPENVKQAKKWMEDHYYTFTAKSPAEEEHTYYQDFFQWGTEESDLKGYKAALELLKTAKQNAEDIIMVKTDEDARLKALKDFESFTVN